MISARNRRNAGVTGSMRSGTSWTGTVLSASSRTRRSRIPRGREPRVLARDWERRAARAWNAPRLWCLSREGKEDDAEAWEAVDLIELRREALFPDDVQVYGMRLFGTKAKKKQRRFNPGLRASSGQYTYHDESGVLDSSSGRTEEGFVIVLQ